MEVILVASAVSQLALRFVDKCANRLAANARREATTDDTTPTLSRNTDDSFPQAEQNEPPEEGSIASMELRLKNLRSQAKELNSPDTFVQYARVSREANKVEKELHEKRDKQGIRQNGLEIENIARVLSNALGPSTTGVMHRKARSFAMKFVLRVVVFSMLWWYFSWTSHADDGSVMVIDCRAVRPLSFLLSKRMPSCAEGDWVCAASLPECKIPFTLAFGMCNVALAMIAKAFT